MIVSHNDAEVFGGLERWLAGTLAGLQERGHEVVVLCRNERMGARFESFGVPWEVLHLGGVVAIHDAVRLGRRLKQLQPEGFLISSFRKSWLAALGARHAKVPRVVVRLGLQDYRPGRRSTYRWAFTKGSDRIVANSEAMRRATLEDLPGLDPQRVVTVYNGVNPPQRCGEDGTVRKELGVPAGAHVLCVLARLEPQKQLDRFVRLVAELGSGVHGLLAGSGEEEPTLRQLATDLGAEPRVHFLGYREDSVDVLRASDLYIVCSRAEGMSNAMLEAMAQGVPVVSTPVSGAQEALEKSDASDVGPGVVVGGSEAEFEEVVRGLLADPVQREAMGREGERRVVERFDWSRMIEIWERLLTRDVHSPVPLRR